MKRKRGKLKSEKKIISPFPQKKEEEKRDWRVKKKLFSYYKGNGGWKEENKMKHSLIPKEKEIIEGITSSPITKNMEVEGKWKKAIHPFEKKMLDERNKCSPIAKEKEKVGKKIY